MPAPDDAPEAPHYLAAPAGFSDWRGLHVLLAAAFAPMEGRIDPPSSMGALTPDLLRAKAEEETLIIAMLGSEAVACGFCKHLADALYLGKLAVRADLRRRGILRGLVRLAEEMARAQGKRALQLQTRIELVENRATFAALGFVKTGETSHSGYDRPTSITMRKPL